MRVRSIAALSAEREKVVVETQAKARLAVAQFDRDAAEMTKQKEILLGEGESQRRQLVMAADGALTQKLEAWVKVNALYAQAMGAYQGAWVPSVVMGANGAATPLAGSGPVDFINLMTMKAAKDLALDLEVNQPRAVSR